MRAALGLGPTHHPPSHAASDGGVDGGAEDGAAVRTAASASGAEGLRRKGISCERTFAPMRERKEQVCGMACVCL